MAVKQETQIIEQMQLTFAEQGEGLFSAYYNLCEQFDAGSNKSFGEF
jgi:hypothetical protein